MVVGGQTRALITGASRGIGRALALELDSRGAALGLIARGREGLEALAADLSGEPQLFPADVSRDEEVTAAVAEFTANGGAPDLLVANAGLAHYGPFADMPAELLEEMVRVNVLGSVLTVKAGLDAMLDRGRGHIVVVSSGAALRSFPWAAVYGATKAAQRMFAEALRHELADSGVSVTTVFPGEIVSSLHDHEKATMPAWYHGDSQAAPASSLAAAVLAGIEADRRSVAYPREVRLLALNAVAPGAVDRLLRRLRGPSAAPRR